AMVSEPVQRGLLRAPVEPVQPVLRERAQVAGVGAELPLAGEGLVATRRADEALEQVVQRRLGNVDREGRGAHGCLPEMGCRKRVQPTCHGNPRDRMNVARAGRSDRRVAYAGYWPTANTRSSWSLNVPAGQVEGAPCRRRFARTACRLPDGNTYLSHSICAPVCAGVSVAKCTQAGAFAFAA